MDPSNRDSSQPLTAVQARELLTELLGRGGLNIPQKGHVRDRMRERDVSVAQIVKIAQKGVVPYAGEWENGSWRYQVWRGEVGIVVMFVVTDKSRVCTVVELGTRKRRDSSKAATKGKK